MQNFCSEPEYTVSGYRSCEASILLHLTQLMFGSLRPSLNALFRGTEVVKHPFYSIGPKLMFMSVSENFSNLRQVTRCKTCLPSLNALFRGTNVVKHHHWTQNDVWECFGAFR
jgi:hypothetical protein